MSAPSRSVSSRYDVAIIGSGIAGSTLAAILARQGRRVIVFEAKAHPRFAIGESMILETSETLRAMSELYDVPELAYYSSEHYLRAIGTSHGVKRHFGFLHHQPGRPHDPNNPRRTLQAVIPREPHGHELHLYRQDADYALMTTAVRYGARVLQQVRVESVAFAPEGATLVTSAGSFEADYVVDASGYRSVLAEQFGLRHQELATHSRAIFTHLVDVPCFHDVNASQRGYGLPFPMSEGTLHHVFPGGWLWVIPFNNHPGSTNPRVSVGLMLDPRVYPARPELSPEQEFFAFLDQFPSIRNQLERGRAVHPWTRTGRIQYGSTQVVGDRWCLLGHAAGFVDPLFSKGLYVSMFCTSLLAHLLLEADRTNGYTAEAFRPLERTTQAFLHANDRLVAGAYRTFADHRLWQPYSVLWLLGAHTELLKLFSARAQATEPGRIDRTAYFDQLAGLELVGGGFSEFQALSESIQTTVDQVDLRDEAGIEPASARMKARLEQTGWMPMQFRRVLRGKNHLAKRKFGFDSFRQAGGLLGWGVYRDHFFGSTSQFDLVRFLIAEKLKYGAVSVMWSRSRSRDRVRKGSRVRDHSAALYPPRNRRMDLALSQVIPAEPTETLPCRNPLMPDDATPIRRSVP